MLSATRYTQGRAGAVFLTGHISVVGAQMKYEDEQSESTIDAVGRCWATTLRKQQRGPSWNPCMVYARHHFKGFFACAKERQYSQVRKFSAPSFWWNSFSPSSSPPWLKKSLKCNTLRCPETTLFGTFHLHHGWRNFEFWYSQMPPERLILVIFFLLMIEEILNFDTLRCPRNDLFL